MRREPVIQVYKKDSPYSYTAGAYVTYELINTRPELAEAVYIHSSFTDSCNLEDLCRKKNIPAWRNDSAFKRINLKENTYSTAIFHKYFNKLSPDKPHVVLVNPSDMGNLGSAMRTLAGVNITNLAIIEPAADIWHPKTIRASMGAIFRIEIELFQSFTQYRKQFPDHDLFPFMLDGQFRLSTDNCPRSFRYALIFGNEGTGLHHEFKSIGSAVRLTQSAYVDSMNLSVAIGIGTFIFANTNGQL